MAARAKRWNPSPEDVLGAIPTSNPGQSQVGSIVGRAQKTAGGTDLQQLGAALNRFNPVLEKYMLGKTQRGMHEADQYLREMEQSVSDNAYDFKTGLRKAGYSQWRNPHVYRNQIMNIAGNTAYKDADFLRTNEEFLAAIELAKKGDNFAQEAEQIAEQHLAAHRQRQPENKKEGGYWDAGYAPKWMDARQRLIAPFLQEKVASDRNEVLESFYEQSRNHLLDVIKLNQPDTKQPGSPINIKPLREYISKQWASYPDDNHSFNQAIFQKVIQPVFLDLAEDPDNELILESVYERVMKMTREDKSGKRHQMFKRFMDGTSGGGDGRGGFLDSDSFAEKMFDVQAMAHHKQYSREMEEIKRVSHIIDLEIKDRANNDLQHIPFPYNEQGVQEAADILLKDERFTSKWIRKGGDYHSQNVYRDMVRDMSRAVYSDNLAFMKKEEDYGEILQDNLAKHMSPFLKKTEFYKEIQGLFSDAVGGASNLDDARAAARKLLNPEALVNRFIWANPTFKPEAVGVQLALTAAMERSLDNSALAKQNDLIQMASNLASGRDKLTDPFELLAELKDAQNETFESEDDEAIGRAIKMVESHVNISDNWTQLERDEKDIITSIIDGSSDSLLKEVIAPQFEYKFRQADDLTDAEGVSLAKPSSLEKEAAHKALDAMKEDIQQTARKLLNRYHLAHPDPTERQKHWDEKGYTDLKTALTEEMRKRVNIYTRVYKDHLRWSPEGQAAREAQQLKLGAQLKKAEDTITSIEGQMESHFRDLGQSTNEKVFNDNQKGATGTHSAVQFWTGPSGFSLKQALNDKRRLRKEEFNREVENYGNTMGKYREAQKVGDLDAQKELLVTIQGHQEYLRNSQMMGDGLDWRQWIDENGNFKEDYNLNIPVEGEDDLEVPFNVVTHQLSANTHLLYTSWDQIDDLNVEINASEIGEWEFSGEAKGFFKIWKLMHGKDINPQNYNLEDPKQLALLQEAHTDYDQKMRGQMIKFMARMPQELPESASNQIENHVVSEFLGSDHSIYQNTSWTPAEKQHFDRFLQHNQKVLNEEYNIEDGFGWEAFKDISGVISNGQYPVYRYEIKDAAESGEQLGRFGTWWRDFTVDLDGNMLGRATGRLPAAPKYYTIESGKQRDGAGAEYSLGSETLGQPELGDAGDALTGKKFSKDSKYGSQEVRKFGKIGDVEKTQERLDKLGLDFNAIPRRDRIGQQYILAQQVALAEMNYNSPHNLPDMEQMWVPFGRSTSGTGLRIDPDEFKRRTEHYVGVLSGGAEMNSARAKAVNLLIKRSGYTKGFYGDRTNVFGVAPLTIPHKEAQSDSPFNRLKPWGAKTANERLHLQGLHEPREGTPNRGKVPEMEQTMSPDGLIQPAVEQLPPGPDGEVRRPTRLTPDAPWVHEEQKKEIGGLIQNPKERKAVQQYLDKLFPDRVKQRTAEVMEGANKREAERYRTSPPKGATPKADALPTVPEIIQQIQDEAIQKLVDKVPKPKINKPKPKK
jgi:hypothetical protein